MREGSTTRPARIVTVCVRGRPLVQAKGNARRIQWLEAVIAEITSRNDWRPIDAVLFPGGYFWLDKPLIAVSKPERANRILAAPFAEVCRQAATLLDDWSPGALFVIGLDTAAAHKRLYGDQTITVWSRDGLKGHTLKAIPVADEAAGSVRRRLAMRPEIYHDPHRFVRLANGEVAVLGVCYDAFGLAATAGGSTAPLNAVCLLTEALHAKPPSLTIRRELIDAWQNLFAAHRPSLALIAVHGFEWPGRDGYWQRHGIATASAALRGGLAVGTGHFRYALPSRANQSPLAACGVPDRHLREGTLRRAHGLYPLDVVWVTGGSSQLPQALVRLFEGALTPPVKGEEVA